MTKKSFEELAMRTASEFMHFDRAHIDDVISVLQHAKALGESADFLKKSMFHGSRGTPNEVNESSWQKEYYLQHRDYIHAVLGLISEIGELSENLINGVFAGLGVDKINLKEEVGDNQWYIALLAKYGLFSISEAQDSIIAKLANRYSDKFSAEDCLNRDTSTERSILENAA